MKKNKEKRLPQQQLVKGANEALLEGASQMSGVTAKELAKGMVTGALMAEAGASQKLRRKMQRKEFLKKFKKTKEGKVTVDPKEIKKKVLKEDLKGNIKVGRPVPVGVKPKNPFKMKGFSGFGDGTSPLKNTDVTEEYKKKGNKETKKFIAQGGKVIRKKDGSLIKTK